MVAVFDGVLPREPQRIPGVKRLTAQPVCAVYPLHVDTRTREQTDELASASNVACLWPRNGSRLRLCPARARRLSLDRGRASRAISRESCARAAQAASAALPMACDRCLGVAGTRSRAGRPGTIRSVTNASALHDRSSSSICSFGAQRSIGTRSRSRPDRGGTGARSRGVADQTRTVGRHRSGDSLRSCAAPHTNGPLSSNDHPHLSASNLWRST